MGGHLIVTWRKLFWLYFAFVFSESWGWGWRGGVIVARGKSLAHDISGLENLITKIRELTFTSSALVSWVRSPFFIMLRVSFDFIINRLNWLNNHQLQSENLVIWIPFFCFSPVCKSKKILFMWMTIKMMQCRCPVF